MLVGTTFAEEPESNLKLIAVLLGPTYMLAKACSPVLLCVLRFIASIYTVAQFLRHFHSPYGHFLAIWNDILLESYSISHIVCIASLMLGIGFFCCVLYFHSSHILLGAHSCLLFSVIICFFSNWLSLHAGLCDAC